MSSRLHHMDNYLIRTPRVSTSTGNSGHKRDRALIQSTIESLPGVVVVEDILRWKAMLNVEQQSTVNLTEALTQLAEKIPSRNVLKSTKIGHAVKRLSRHADRGVSRLAGRLVARWSAHYEAKRDRPLLEVRCGAKTEERRETSRRLLGGALTLASSSAVVDAIEREVFCRHRRLLSNGYRRAVRTLVFILRNKADVRNSVNNGALHAPQLVSEHTKSSS